MMPRCNLKGTTILSAGAEFVLKWAIFFNQLGSLKIPTFQMTLYDGSTHRNEQISLADAHMVLAKSDWEKCVNELVTFSGFSVYHSVHLGEGKRMKFSATEGMDGEVDLSISVICPELLSYIFFMRWTVDEPGGMPETKLVINEEVLSECDFGMDILRRARFNFTPWLPSLHENFLTKLGLGTAD